MTDLEMAEALRAALRAITTRLESSSSPTPAEQRNAIDLLHEADRMWGEPLVYPPEETTTSLRLAGCRVFDGDTHVGDVERGGKMFVFRPTLGGMQAGYTSQWASSRERLIRFITKA